MTEAVFNQETPSLPDLYMTGGKAHLRLASQLECEEARGMNPLVYLIPIAVATGGVLCFFLLRVPLWVRATILVSDLVAAVILCFVLARRFGR